MSDIHIHWFPGHMKKARNAVEEKLKACDGVIEIGDSRAPFSSFPDSLDALTKGKAKIFVLSKKDLADPARLKEAMARYREKGIQPYALNLTDPKSAKEIVRYLGSLRTSKDARFEKLGFPLPMKTFMVLGIPNVGKSTLINYLAGKKKAAVENRPGKTRDEPLIKINDKVQIFDTPGILEPNYQDPEVIGKLALLGSVKADLVPVIPLSDYLLDLTYPHYESFYRKRYGIVRDGSDEEYFYALAQSRKFLLKGEEVDVMRARSMVLTEFRNGILGPLSLDE